jgi:hypothetical protein
MAERVFVDQNLLAEAIHQLRSRAAVSLHIAMLVRHLQLHFLPRELHPIDICVAFREAFHLTLIEVKPIADWLLGDYFHIVPNRGDDECLDRWVLPHILRNRTLWEAAVQDLATETRRHGEDKKPNESF